jgi:hypothetical protein
MQGHRFIQTIHIPGTLAADINVRWKLPFDCRLKHISAVASNNSDATLAVGDSGDIDAILAASAIGDGNTPAQFDAGDWAAANPTAALGKGDVLVYTLDFDGDSGTAAQNVTVVATFLEG